LRSCSNVRVAHEVTLHRQWDTPIV